MKPGSEKDFGFVTAQIMLNVADDNDEDDLPNYVPASGTVKFSPKEVLLVTDDPALFLTRETVLCPIDPDTGKMVNPGTPKTEGVWLAAGIWTVSFSIGSRTSVQIPSFEVQITSSYTASNPLNLATVVPYTPPSDVTVIVVKIPAGGNPGDVLTWGDGGFHWQSNDAQAVRAETAAELVASMSAGVASPARTVQWSGTVELPDSGGFIEATLVGDTVLDLYPRGATAEIINILVRQDATGGRTLNIPDALIAFGVPYTASTTAGAADLLSLVWTGSQWLCLPGALNLQVPA